jgi:hypothetical protein
MPDSRCAKWDHLVNWKDGAPPLDSIPISLPLPDIAIDVLSPQIHQRARSISSPKMSSFVTPPMKTQIFSGRRPRVRIRETSRWRGLLQTSSAARNVGSAVFQTIWRRCLALQQCVRPSIHRHQARFVTDPALGDQSRIGIFRDDGQCVIGCFNAYSSIRPSPPTPALFPMVCHASYVSSLLLARHSGLLADSSVSIWSLSLVLTLCGPWAEWGRCGG